MRRLLHVPATTWGALGYKLKTRNDQGQTRSGVFFRGAAIVLAVALASGLGLAPAAGAYEPDNQDPFCAYADQQIWGEYCYAYLILWGGEACATWPHSCPGQCTLFGYPPPPDCPECPWDPPSCEPGGGSGGSRPACCQYGQTCVQVSCYVMIV